MSIYSDFCAIFADDGVITWRVVVDDEFQDWIESHPINQSFVPKSQLSLNHT
ncbi:hypothetical protein L916_05579 [Phytophthora nicotianae]|uniref:Uncharacterized protein n=2 Tax=Phytophthora nicotianae TaxID=4792 RepID=W2JCA4_PHYNI|nr:hypothetical protein L916_05579 [Phytophthora nicotianae]ETO79500.1 hypothetical protein F444_05822 [Phytophthora nicotianae P1976]